jgi:hypothetical protein
VLLHDTEELDDDFRARADQALALAGLLGVVDVLERIVENGGANHFDGWCEVVRFSSRGNVDLRYLHRILLVFSWP